ncbi:acyltransferase family protein [Rhodococcus sp. NPDC003348]
MPARTAAPVDASARQAGSTRRADLDGLRGLAIALVVLFHVWFGRVSGGVDVFLMLSGFFFVGSLVRAAESSSPLDPRPILARTARRLLAPLAVVVAATAVAGALLLAPTAWLALAEQSRAALLFGQNWQLARTAADYLAADPSVSPLQHLWSISVQGQFYLLALTVVFASAWLLRLRGVAVRGPITAILAVATAVSFCYAASGAQPQTWMYYDTGARLWELLAGGLLACAMPWLRVPRQARVLLGVVGLVVVACTGVLLDGRHDFPGPWALVPVAATAAIVVAGAAASVDAPATRLLGSAPLRRLGDVAYSLYLWHWPLLIFALVLTDRERIGLRGGLVVIGLSLVLAHLTTRLVEEPIRRGNPSPRRTALVAGVGALAVAVFATATGWIGTIANRSVEVAHIADLDPRDYPGAAVLVDGVDAPERGEQPNRFVAHLDVPPSWDDGCLATDEVVEVIRCSYGEPDAARTVALIGGSHSEHWLPALASIADDRGLRIDTYLKVGCPAILPVDEDTANGECERWTATVLDELESSPPDLVFSTSTRPRPDDVGGDYTPDGYVRVWDRMATLGLPMTVVRDTPWLSENGIAYRAPDCLAHGGNADTCGVDRAAVLDVVDPAEAASAHLPTVHPLDLSDAVCRADRCRVIEGNRLIYRDGDHLTTAYVRSLAPELDRRLGAATGWW